MTPVFSIVIPTRNGERYLGATLESVLSQTYPHFRAFVLESGSTDNTIALVRSFQDPRITLLSSPENLGIEANWKRILTLDLDPYLTILGHDDLLYPEFLKEIHALTQREPEASLYHTHFNLIDSEGSVTRPCYPVPFRESAESFLRALHQLRRDSFATGYVMRAEHYRSVGGYPPFPDLMYADHWTAYNLARISYKVCSPKTLFAFREHANSTSHTTQLWNIFYASKLYFQALEGTAYSFEAENRVAARGYVEFVFNSHYHRILVDLIASGDAEQRREYQRVKDLILEDHFEQPLFRVYDTASRLYEFVAEVRPRALRRSIHTAITIFRRCRKKRLRSQLDRLNR